MITLSIMYELHKHKVDELIKELENKTKDVIIYKNAVISDINLEAKKGNITKEDKELIIRGKLIISPHINTSYDRFVARRNNDIKELIKEEDKLNKEKERLQKLSINKELFNYIIKEYNRAFIDNVINNDTTEVIKDVGMFKLFYYNQKRKTVNWFDSLNKKKELINNKEEFTFEDYIKYFPDERIYLKYLYPKSFYIRLPIIKGYKFIAYKTTLLKLAYKLLSLDEETFNKKFKKEDND